MNKQLQLIFINAAGTRMTINVQDPRDNLTAAEALAAMNTMIAKNIFVSTGGNLVGIASARIVTRDVTELVVA